MSMSHATLAMWTNNIQAKAENAIAATTFDLDQREDILAQVQLLFLTHDAGMDGTRPRSIGECVAYCCRHGLILQARRELGYTPTRVMIGPRGSNTKAYCTACEAAYKASTGELDLRRRLLVIEDLFRPRVEISSEDWFQDGGDIADNYMQDAAVPRGVWNANVAAFLLDAEVSHEHKSLVSDLMSGFSFAELSTKNGIDPDGENRNRDFARKVAKAYAPTDRKIDADFAAYDMEREPKYAARRKVVTPEIILVERPNLLIFPLARTRTLTLPASRILQQIQNLNDFVNYSLDLCANH